MIAPAPIYRETDAAAVNAIANSPAVLPLLGGNQFDFSACVADDRNIVLTAKGFCALFVWSAPGVYECHVMALPEFRGAFAFRAAADMLDIMRDHGARIVWGQPCATNRQAICFIRRMGLSEQGSGTNPIVGPVRYFMKELAPCPPQ